MEAHKGKEAHLIHTHPMGGNRESTKGRKEKTLKALPSTPRNHFVKRPQVKKKRVGSTPILETQ